MNEESLLEILLSMEGVNQKKHFDREAFFVKRIFATLSKNEKTLNVKLTPDEQLIFCQDPSYQLQKVPNKWGDQGWTTCRYTKITRPVLEEIIRSAYKSSL